jgi:mRNA-degrading endonuclease RelE of RelBE toxin-antitoxin system
VDQDLKRFSAHVRAEVIDAIEIHLRHEPTKTSRSRIKGLRGLSRPQYRLRVRDIRVFYDVEGRSVHILAVVLKPDAARWLEQVGKQS